MIFCRANRDPNGRYNTLPQFSNDCMRSTIDYCIMKSKIKFDTVVRKRLVWPRLHTLHCWEEQIYDIYDYLVGVVKYSSIRRTWSYLSSRGLSGDRSK
jgi:hypothetical protein